MSNKIKEKVEGSIEDKLLNLYQLQLIDSQIDKIKIIRGELPLEVEDLEDLVAGLDTRVNNLMAELETIEVSISDKTQAIKDFKSNIKKYEAQLGKVRNNREHDAISKEVNFQKLEIELAEKRLKEAKYNQVTKTENLESCKLELTERSKDLKVKKSELNEIITETEKEEQDLLKKSTKKELLLEPRLLTIYKKVRSNSKNGLAVVPLERDSCGGCFNKIPPQRQIDIKLNKKILVCEHCGRVVIDPTLVEN